MCCINGFSDSSFACVPGGVTSNTLSVYCEHNASCGQSVESCGVLAGVLEQDTINDPLSQVKAIFINSLWILYCIVEGQ